VSYRFHQQGSPALHLIVIVGIVIFSLRQEVCTASVLSVFHQQSLRNFVFDSSSGSLYVGGVNVIYKLGGNLHQDAVVDLGPHHDIVECGDSSSFSLDCMLASETSDSVNQALVLDADSQVLIACGTLYYGSCAKISIADFSAAEYIYRPVVPNDGSKSVTVVIAPGFTGSSMLYVGAAYSTRGAAAIRDRVSLFSIRQLPTFEIASVETDSKSSVHILSAFQDNFEMHFVRSYHFNGHVYFFFRRPSSFGSSEITSHVLRICTSDRKMHSIVELRLQCSVNNAVYPYLRDVTLIDFNPPLQMQDSSSVAGSTLVGIFTSTAEDAGNSAVCLYQMTGKSGVEFGFLSVIKNCFNGSGDTGPEYLVNPDRCTQTVSCFEIFSLYSFSHLVCFVLFTWMAAGLFICSVFV